MPCAGVTALFLSPLAHSPHEHLLNVVVLLPPCIVQWSATPTISFVCISSRLDQVFDDVELPLRSCQMQGCAPIVVG